MANLHTEIEFCWKYFQQDKRKFRVYTTYIYVILYILTLIHFDQLPYSLRIQIEKLRMLVEIQFLHNCK